VTGPKERMPSEAVAYCDGYEAGLNQGRREAARHLRQMALRYVHTPEVSKGLVLIGAAAEIMRGEADT
jgi:hypothetical protein